MIKSENIPNDREEITQPAISINTDLIREIQKVFKDNWSVSLTKIEQQILKVLYYEKSALNVYEIRRDLIFSTTYHILKKSIKEREGFYFNAVKTIQDMLNLEKYEKYPSFTFSEHQTTNFLKCLSERIENKVLSKPRVKPAHINIEKMSPAEQMFSYYLINKTQAEELFYLVLRDMKIEVYGFKTISDALNNLFSMKVILTREIKIGKSKKVFFLNPLIITHINRENGINASKPNEITYKEVKEK